MFDLPVVEKVERKAATYFRNALLDMGFEMSQFSVYMRFCSSQGQVDTYCTQLAFSSSLSSRSFISYSLLEHYQIDHPVLQSPADHPV